VSYQELQEEGDRDSMRPPTMGSCISMTQSTVFLAIAQDVGTPLLFSDGNVLLGLNYLRSEKSIDLFQLRKQDSKWTEMRRE